MDGVVLSHPPRGYAGQTWEKIQGADQAALGTQHLVIDGREEFNWDLEDSLLYVQTVRYSTSNIHCWHTLRSQQFDEDEESLSSFVTCFEVCSQQLRFSGARIDETDIVSHFLYALPSSFDSIVDALQTLSQEKMTMELVKNHLFNFELERKTKLWAETVVEDKNLVALFAGSSNAEQVGNTVKCDKCGRLNHLAQDCYQNRLKCHKCGGLGHVRKSVQILRQGRVTSINLRMLLP